MSKLCNLSSISRTVIQKSTGCGLSVARVFVCGLFGWSATCGLGVIGLQYTDRVTDDHSYFRHFDGFVDARAMFSRGVALARGN